MGPAALELYVVGRVVHLWRSYNQTMPPNSNPCFYGDENFPCDGVRTVQLPSGWSQRRACRWFGPVRQAVTIGPSTWWALGSRNGGEVISADQY